MSNTAPTVITLIDGGVANYETAVSIVIRLPEFTDSTSVDRAQHIPVLRSQESNVVLPCCGEAFRASNSLRRSPSVPINWRLFGCYFENIANIKILTHLQHFGVLTKTLAEPDVRESTQQDELKYTPQEI